MATTTSSLSIQRVDYTLTPTSETIYNSLNKQYTESKHTINTDLAEIGSSREQIEVLNKGLYNKSCTLSKEELKTKAEGFQKVYDRISLTLTFVKDLNHELDRAIDYIEPSLNRLIAADLMVLDPTYVPTHETALKRLASLKEESKDIRTILDHMVTRIKPLESSLESFLAQANPPTQRSGYFDWFWKTNPPKGAEKKMEATNASSTPAAAPSAENKEVIAYSDAKEILDEPKPTEPAPTANTAPPASSDKIENPQKISEQPAAATSNTTAETKTKQETQTKNVKSNATASSARGKKYKKKTK